MCWNIGNSGWWKSGLRWKYTLELCFSHVFYSYKVKDELGNLGMQKWVIQIFPFILSGGEHKWYVSF